MRISFASAALAVRDGLARAALFPAAWLATAMGSLAYGQENADPLAPIPQMQAAQTAAKKSTLNVTDFKSGSTTVVNVLMYAGVAIGTGMALWSLYKLYRGANDETGRESSGRAITGLIVGSLITVFTIIIGVVVNYGTGNN